MRRERFGVFTVDVPQTWRERVHGLSGRDALAPHEGLLLRRCRSVHTFGMRFPIDAVLFDREVRVVAVVSMPPGRVLLPRRRVHHILEVAAGRGVVFGPPARGGRSRRRRTRP